MLKVLDVDGAVRRVRGGWESTGAPWEHDAARYERIATARAAEQDAMRAYPELAQCRLEFLRQCLDDPAAVPCGRCDNCAGVWYPAVVSPDALAASRSHLGRAGVEIVPRRQWPTGLTAIGVPLAGRIPTGEQSEPGRAIGRLSDLGWGDRLRRLTGDSAPDQPVPDEVFDGAVETLAAWARGDDRWSTRPVAVVTIGSRRRPLLLDSLGERIAAIGRLPLLGSVRPASPTTDANRPNSAQRVRALHQAFVVPDELRARLASLDGPVLLVDDLVDSGWTMALVTRLLRQSGAPGVLPFALALAA
jgi:ATP-dependent DNA helicase RecQ